MLTEILVIGLSVAFGALTAHAGPDAPLPGAATRATPLHFGLYVTPDPAQNPIDPPERFTGFHAGLDYEIGEGEADAEVPVSAICDGEIAAAGWVRGYGGLVRQRCVIDDRTVTVLYGHLAVPAAVEAGQQVTTGARIGVLGAYRSHDTDGNRKHLHLGIRKGWDDDVRGYVQSEEELSQYLDPAAVLP